MPAYFGLSIRFLDQAFHGRRDGGAPEWPPSPLRAFQSLVAAAAWRGCLVAETSIFEWLEKQSAPVIVAPEGIKASSYRLSVPNNAMDIVAKAWCRGNDSNTGDANPATHRTMKTVRPTLMRGGDAVHYLWSVGDAVTDDIRHHVGMLADIARGMVVLGWGIDMVIGHGAIVSHEQAEALAGERWLPSTGTTSDGLRVPAPGTLGTLINQHERFLHRLGPDGFTAPPPLPTYATVRYRRATDPSPRPLAAFSLLKVDASGFRGFDTARRALTITGMMRHATKLAAGHAGWDDRRINAFILGHGDARDRAAHVAVGARRFAYLPLPSVEARGEGKARFIGNVRRVLLFSFAEGCDDEIAWARRALSGQELINQHNGEHIALLSLIPATGKVVRHYTQPAASWATVTPVVLPGYDDPAHYRRRLKQGVRAQEQKQLLDRLSDRIDRLLRKAITQAGFSQVLADQAELEWRRVGFWPGVDVADCYGVPNHLRRFPRVHVRLQWRDRNMKPVEVAGPICLGGGRFYGLGLFAAL